MVVLIASIVGVPLCCALTALATGVRALRVIRGSGGAVKGRGLALTGIVLGAVGLAFSGLVAAGVGVQWYASARSLAGVSNVELEGLVHSDVLRSDAAANLLAARGEAGRARLIAVLRDRSVPPEHRLSVLRALKGIRGMDWTPLLPELLAILGGTDFELQTEVGSVVGLYGGIAVARLLPFLTDPDPVVRAGAIAAVGTQVQFGSGWAGGLKLGAAELPLLIAALEQPGDRDVRLAVIGWLEGMGGAARPARMALQAAAADQNDGDVSAAAQAVLATLGQ